MECTITAPKHSRRVSGLNFGTAIGHNTVRHRETRTSRLHIPSLPEDSDIKKKATMIGATGTRLSKGTSHVLRARECPLVFEASVYEIISKRSFQYRVSSTGLVLLECPDSDRSVSGIQMCSRRTYGSFALSLSRRVSNQSTMTSPLFGI